MNQKYTTLCRFMTLGALALGLLFAPAVRADEPADPTQHYSGMNTWFPRDWDGARPFADMMHLSRAWSSMTSNDLSITFTTGSYTVATVTTQLFVNGTYNLQFTGQATVSVAPWEVGSVTISNLVWNPTSNVTTGLVTAAFADNANAPKRIDLVFTDTKHFAGDVPPTGLAGISLTYPAGVSVNNPSLAQASYAVTDADGWPLTDAWKYIIADTVTGFRLNGVYKLQFNGQADIGTTVGGVFTISGKTYDAVSNTTTANLTITSTSALTVSLTFANTRRTAASALRTGITNVRLWRPGYIVAPNTPLNTAPMFSTEYKTILGKAQVIRFMDWNEANENPCITWAERARPDHDSWNHGLIVAGGRIGRTGVPYEVMVRLCNETTNDLFICVPALANDAYLTNLAQLILYGSDGVNPYTSPQANPVWPPLNANLKVYVEYFNETWNSLFATQGWIKQLVDAQIASPTVFPIEYDGTINSGNAWSGVWRYIGYRSSEISQVFRGVFGDAAMPGTSANPRIRPLVMSQLANPNGLLNPELQFLEKFYGSINAFNPTVRNVNYFFYGAGGSAYYAVNGSQTGTTNDPNVFFSAGPGNYITSDWRDKIFIDALWAGNYGLKRISYEGGLGLPDVDNALWNATTRRVINADPRMQGVVEEYHDAWTESGGDLLVYYVVAGAAPWEFTPAFDKFDSPKLLGLDTIRTNTRNAVTSGTVLTGSPATGTATFRSLNATYQIIKLNTFDDNTGEISVGGVDPGDWITFGVATPASNIYSASIRYKKSSTTSATVGVWVNGVLQTTQILPGTSSVMTNSASFNLTLPKDLAVIRIKNSGSTSGLSLAAFTVAVSTNIPVIPVTNQMVARWTFDGDLLDSAPADALADDGTGNGGPTYVTGTNAVLGTGALSVNGTGQYVSASSSVDTAITGDLSVAAWIRPTAYPGGPANNAGLVAKWLGVPSAQRSYTLQITPTGQIIFAVSSTGVSIPTSSLTTVATVPLGSWSHVSGVYDSAGAGSFLKVYINGTLVSTLSSGVVTSVFNSTSPVTIGHAYDLGASQYSFNGRIDDARIYNYALTAAEVGAAMSPTLTPSTITAGFNVALQTIQLSFPTTSGQAYTLLESTNLTLWSAVTNWTGSGAVEAMSLPFNPAPGGRYFRLRSP